MDVNNNGTDPAEGSKITRWFNKSTSGHALRDQTNSALRPTYSKTGMNGLPAVMFGMNNADGLELFSTSTDNVLNSDWSMVVASKYYRNASGGGDWNSMLGNENGNSGLGFHFERNSGRSRIKHRGANIYGRSYEDGGSFIVMIVKKGKKVYLYLNGKLEQEITASSVNMESSRAFYLGQIDGGNANAGWFHKGPVAEVLFYDHSINDDQKEYLEGYLMHKWKFADKLSLDHTFKENSPLDVNLNTPNGETLVFDGNVSSNTVLFDENNKFGDFTFTTSGASCAESNSRITITNTGLIGDDMVTYSVNQGKFKVGSQIEMTELESLELKPNYEINGDYQWEKPDGTLLALNTNPELFTVTFSDDESVWKLHVKQDEASCVMSDKVYQVHVQVSEVPESEKDDDLDGVKNNVDQCPNSIAGAVVNSMGCFDLPANNFIVETVSETCMDTNNGSISIKAAKSFDYTVTLNSFDAYAFTDEIALEDLAPGDYLACITIEGVADYEQCFSLTVGAAKAISSKSVQTKKGNVVTENIEITSGTAPYTISINGKKMLTTASRKFAIDVNHGDKITVSAKNICEGMVNNDIDLVEHFSVYPNPTTDIVQVTIPALDVEEVIAVVYNSLHQVISEKNYILVDGKIQLSLNKVPPGIYFVSLQLDTPVNLKIVKE